MSPVTTPNPGPYGVGPLQDVSAIGWGGAPSQGDWYILDNFDWFTQSGSYAHFICDGPFEPSPGIQLRSLITDALTGYDSESWVNELTGKRRVPQFPQVITGIRSPNGTSFDVLENRSGCWLKATDTAAEEHYYSVVYEQQADYYYLPIIDTHDAFESVNWPDRAPNFAVRLQGQKLGYSAEQEGTFTQADDAVMGPDRACQLLFINESATPQLEYVAFDVYSDGFIGDGLTALSQYYQHQASGTVFRPIDWAGAFLCEDGAGRRRWTNGVSQELIVSGPSGPEAYDAYEKLIDLSADPDPVAAIQRWSFRLYTNPGIFGTDPTLPRNLNGLWIGYPTDPS